MKMGKTLAYYVILFFLGGILSSCNPFAIQGPEPAFIDINEPVFIHSLNEGTRQHRVTNVEVFFEGFSIGFYQLPAKIAVIPTMEVSEMQIFPAVQLNGDLTGILKYNAMTEYEVIQTFEIAETYSITPEFDYQDNMIFDYVEGFESGNSLNFDADEVDSTVTVRTSDEAAEGIHSCLISTEKNGFIAAATNFLFTGLLNGGQDVFVEFQYKADGPVVMGMRAEGNNNSQLIPFITLVEQSDWRKMYLDISPLVLQVPAEGYRLYFLTEGGEGEFANEVYVDNIKILHQE